ncbi:MAG TPA: hypothetical protein VNO30_06260 [Kofleriaceae bacterium]|nr:hypothetical protein [Kofleriaceae bacterium]
MSEDLHGRYHEYLERFERALGDLPVGAFAKFGGRLIKKLSFEEFSPAYLKYEDLRVHYQKSIERGDTIDDIVRRILREDAANLVLEPPD